MMENWEFFLQKVGEENWLSIDSPQPEFPNGRYVIAARAAHRPKEWIEVDISTRNNLRTRERVHKHQHACQLDETGFAILVAEIELTPGLWEIQCRGDILSALMGKDWQVTLLLRVTLGLEKAAAHFQPAATPTLALPANVAETDPEEDLSQLRSRLINDADQVFQEVIDDLFPRVTPSLHLDPLASTSDYSLHLDEEILIAQTTKPIIVSGQITTQQQPPHPQLRLNISLRDPRTGDTVAELSPRLREQNFPLTFCYSLSVPSACESYLLEGEVTLCEDRPRKAGKTFASEGFTVSAKWENLQPFLIGAITTATVSHPPAPLSPLNPQQPQGTASYPSRWQGVFPPKLSTQSRKKKKTPPVLPNLPNTIGSKSKLTKPKKPKEKEYVWSKPSPQNDASPTAQWELIPEIVIIPRDETEL